MSQEEREMKLLIDYMHAQDTAGYLYRGDALEILSLLPDESVQCCVTSPPYWGLRDYGLPGQLGLEKTPDEYVSKMVVIFREVRRVLRDDGTLWLNLGDTYFGDSPVRKTGTECFSKEWDKNQTRSRGGARRSASHTDRLKPKDLVGVPWRVAFALQADGWYLRMDIIWSKPNPMPESVTDRPTKAHEYIFLMSKSARYCYDQDAIKEKAITSPTGKSHLVPSGWDTGPGSHKVKAGRYDNRKGFTSDQGGGGAGFHRHSGNRSSDGTEYIKRNKRSVWTVATQPFKRAHFATFPKKIPRDCILAGCPTGGIVLDPFIGSCTTAVVAKALGRRFIGIDLSAEFLDMRQEKLAQGVLIL